jgi:hypothetical protein
LGGGSTHAGDLQILLPLIKALENDVEWVFMGMKPRNVHCEFHPGVPFEMYPEKLANLNLDLALVPLEINQFNECKSNLRLLEIGTCGVPIVATDIAPYRCGLPVTLVENRFKDWMKAIQSYLNDADYRSRQGMNYEMPYSATGICAKMDSMTGNKVGWHNDYAYRSSFSLPDCRTGLP